MQWDFPLEPRPYARPRRAARHPRAGGARADREGQGRRRAAPALGDLRHARARLLVRARRREDRPRPRRRGRRDHQPSTPASATTTSATTRTTSGTRSRCRPATSLDEHIDVLHRESGALVTRKLPTLKLYKIGVKLDMTGKTAANAKTEVLEHERPERKAEMPAPDLSDLELAVDPHRAGRPAERRASVRGSRPTATRRRRVRRDRHDPLVEGTQAHAPLRGGHEPPQRRASRRTRWACGRFPTTSSRRSGRRWRRSRAVSHCYRRPTYDDWPYSVFTMVHGRSARDCEATIDAIRDETGVDEYCLLWSVKEYKKVRLRYFGARVGRLGKRASREIGAVSRRSA